MLSNSIVPLCFSTISLTIERPIPDPFFVRFDLKNFSVILEISFLGILHPVSFTTTLTLSSVAFLSIVILS